MSTTEELRCSQRGVAKQLDEEILQLLVELTKRSFAYFEAQVMEMGLTGPQALLLRNLEAPMPMCQVADKLRCDASNVTGIVDRLEARGLVERRTLLSDRRVKQLVLTEQGGRFCKRIEALLSAVPGVSGLSESERVALRDLLLRAVGASAVAELVAVTEG